MNDRDLKSTLSAIALMLLGLCMAAPCYARAPGLRLYILDCGHATFKDMGGFSDTGEYDGKSGEIADPCFLIRHPKGDLLWDAGLGDHYNYPKEGSDAAPGQRLGGRVGEVICTKRVQRGEPIGITTVTHITSTTMMPVARMVASPGGTIFFVP